MGLSRADLWAFLDGAPASIVAPLINDAYELELWRKWCAGGRPRTSFRLNEFPGDELACGRLAVYNLLDPPDAKPIEPKVQSWFDVGLDLEHHWVERLGNYGSLLSANVTADDSEQTRFEDPDHWCSGLVDVIVLPPGSHKAHVIEVKTTKDSNLQAILDDGKVPNAHAKYMRQLQSYIGYAHEQEFSPEVWVCKKSGLIALVDGVRDDGHVITRCPGKMLPTDRPHRLLHAGECELDRIKVIPPDEGTLIYSSRDEPLKTASFTARYSRSFMDAGRAQMASWRKEGLDVSQLSMAVNASVHEIVAPDYAAYLERTIARHGLTAQQIVIEVTESAVLQSDRFAAGSLETLKALGVELAIDDFGTGYSSLRYLLEFPFSQLKIDGSFVRGADGAIASEAIVSTIVTLAASAGMSTVAEGVETEAQAARLVELGVDALQGYFFSRPISDSSVIELLRKPRLHLVAK